MATIKKACKGTSYPKSSNVSKRLGSPSKAKNGKSFPDLNKDGKITKADILKGRGVIAKKGMKVKKAQNGEIEDSVAEPESIRYRYPGKKSKDIKKTTDLNYIGKSTINESGQPIRLRVRRTVKGFLLGKPSPDKANKSWTREKSKPEGGKWSKQSAFYKKGGKVTKAKTGAKMTKKCMYGCK
jgi:hypothetical protein